MRNCIKCGNEIPEGRIKILPNTKTCVKCSDVSPVKAITAQRGSGDHTFIETVIVEEELFNKYQDEVKRNHRD